MGKEESRVKIVNESLGIYAINNNDVVILEIGNPETEEFINSNDDVRRKLRIVNSSDLKVITRCLRVSDKYVIFIKTETNKDYADRLVELEEHLSDLDLKDRTIHMQKLRYDKCDMAIKVLESTGAYCYYYDGTEKMTDDKSTKKKKARFEIDFTRQEFYEYMRKRIIGQDRELRKATFMVMIAVEAAAYDLDIVIPNWALAAPSGMGKTEFYRAVRDFFRLHRIPIPVVFIDLSQISESGFKGNNMDTIIAELKEAPGNNFGGRAICFLDEADKKFLPSYGSKQTNVNAAVQGNLLTMIDGKYYENYDTTLTMFVFMGAFQSVRDKKMKKARELDIDGKFDSEEEALYSEITVEDMMDTGMTPELGGRIARVVNFHRISDEQMIYLIKDKAETIGKEFDVSIEISEDGLEYLLEEAFSVAGVRRPVSLIRNVVYEEIEEKFFADEEYKGMTINIGADRFKEIA